MTGTGGTDPVFGTADSGGFRAADSGDFGARSSGGFQVPAEPPLAGYPAPGSGLDGTAAGQYPGGPNSGGPQPAGNYSTPDVPNPAWRYVAPPVHQQLPPGHPQANQPSPGYPQANQPYPGYPYPGYPHPAASWPPAPPSRPGTVTGAAVLAFVTGGFDLIGGLIMVGFAATVPSGSLSWWSGMLWVATFAAVAAGGALVAGGVLALRGRPVLMFVGAGVTALLALYWFAASGQLSVLDPDDAAMGAVVTRFYPMLYLALAAVTTGLGLSRSAQRWRPDRAWIG